MNPERENCAGNCQNAITPYPGQQLSDATVGRSPPRPGSSPERGPARPCVIFGGGYTLYALNADTGTVYRTSYPGVPGPPNPNDDSTRIFSRHRWSPTGRVLFGVDEDGQQHSGRLRGHGQPRQRRPGVGVPDRCGPQCSTRTAVAASRRHGTVLPLGLVVLRTAELKFSGSASLRRLGDRVADDQWLAGVEVPPARPRAGL